MAVLSLKDFPDDVYKALRMRAVEEDKTSERFSHRNIEQISKKGGMKNGTCI